MRLKLGWTGLNRKVGSEWSLVVQRSIDMSIWCVTAVPINSVLIWSWILICASNVSLCGRLTQFDQEAGTPDLDAGNKWNAA